LEIPARPASLIPAVGTGDAKVAMGVASIGAASMGVGGKGAVALPVSPRVVSGFWVVSVEAEGTVLVFAWGSVPGCWPANPGKRETVNIADKTA
jgi:hypothetical protein